jgi:two-component system response regulator MprA
VVLLIDDDARLVRMTALALLSDGLSVFTAGNGQEGLVQLAEHEVDVIVLDLQMPVMDGRAFYQALRLQGYRTPVVILSAYGAEGARQELGAEQALAKPFDPEVLIGVVNELSGQARAEAAARS